MNSNERALWRRVFPDPPARRYSVVSGQNSWSEWFSCLPHLFSQPDPGVIEQFEERLAALTGCGHAVAFGAGRMGLHSVLSALDFKPGEEVIVPGFTCVVVINALLYRGLKPVYADIDPVLFNIDPASAESLIGPRTRALLAQHTFGVACDVARLRSLARRHGLILIEDAAHSFGASIGGQPHGSMGDVAIFSTDRTKVINTHVGGFVTTSQTPLAAGVRALRDQGHRPGAWACRHQMASFLVDYALRDPLVLWLGRPLLGALRRTGAMFQWRDEGLRSLPPRYPYPSSMAPALAALGLRQLDGLAGNLAHRRELARLLERRIGWYAARLGDRFDEQAWLRYSFLVRDRKEFCRRFGARIELGIWFPGVIYGGEGREAELGYQRGSCPVAEMVADRIVNLPTHRRIPADRLARLLDAHGTWLEHNVSA